MAKQKPEENRAREDNAGLLSVDDFVKRGVKIDPEWTGFQALLAVAEVASLKYVEEAETINNNKNNEKQRKEILLMREKSLKRPMDSPQHQKLMSSAIINMQKRAPSRSRQKGNPEQIPVLPESFRNLIESLKGTHHRFVIQKVLYKSDVNGNSRMSIPDRQVRERFLYENEIEWLERGLRLPLKVFIEPCLDIFHGMDLFRWGLKKTKTETDKDYKPISYQNVLINKWKNVTIKNGLQIGDVVQVWSFRIDGQLCLALVRLSKAEDSHEDNTQDSEDDDI